MEMNKHPDQEKAVYDIGTRPIESGTIAIEQQYGTVKRGLKSRHIQFIAIGGTIGTGLFVGSGGALARAGPVSLLLGYLIVG